MFDITKHVEVLGARCLVREEKLSETTQSGIIIKDRDKQQTSRGTVLVIGDGAILEDGTKVPMKVAVGDKVIYTEFSGMPVKVNSDDEERYIILNERDIVCKYFE